MLRSGNPHIASSAVELISSVISAKLCENQPSFLSSFASEIEMPAQEDCVFVSCWAFLLCVSEAGSWLDLHTMRMRNRPAFFVPGRCLVRRNDTHPPEVAMLLFDCPHSHKIHSAGDSFIQQVSAYSLSGASKRKTLFRLILSFFSLRIRKSLVGYEGPHLSCLRLFCDIMTIPLMHGGF